MACFSPLHGYRNKDGSISFSARKGTDVEVTVSCGSCIGCRIARTRMWGLRIVHESKLHDRNCFVTLTYSDDHLPPYASLRYRDIQLFHKRLRKAYGPFRFFCVGEYGERLDRPHYHCCYFGMWPRDAKPVNALAPKRYPEWSSEELARIWSHGHVHIGELNYTTASYAAGYIFKKLGGDLGESTYRRVDVDGVVHPIEPPFARMSLRPGIGRAWYERYASDFHEYDVAVLDGKRFPVPKYYDRLLEQSDPDRLSELKECREWKAIPGRWDQSPDRLSVKAEVAAAMIRHFDRRS